MKAVEVFCCYARRDRDLLIELRTHLMPLQRQGLITLWGDTDLNAGAAWEEELHAHLERADIFLLLISPDFMASNYCYGVEMQRAIQRHNQGGARVIPVLLRPVFWQNTPFARFQVIPTNAEPVTSWSDRDKAFSDITDHIHRVIAGRQAQLNQSLSSPMFLSQVVSMTDDRQPLKQIEESPRTFPKRIRRSYGRKIIGTLMAVVISLTLITVEVVFRPLSFGVVPTTPAPFTYSFSNGDVQGWRNLFRATVTGVTNKDVDNDGGSLLVSTYLSTDQNQDTTVAGVLFGPTNLDGKMASCQIYIETVPSFFSSSNYQIYFVLLVTSTKGSTDYSLYGPKYGTDLFPAKKWSSIQMTIRNHIEGADEDPGFLASQVNSFAVVLKVTPVDQKSPEIRNFPFTFYLDNCKIS